MSEAPVVPKTLHQKLLAVQKSVGNYMQAVNEGYQYAYVGSSDVLVPIRNAMDEEGLLLLAEILEHATEAGSQRFTELTVKFTWIDADNPQDREEFRWYGQGLDTGEKGVGKALTYAEKYFLLKTFHIATDKDDPDRFQRQHEDAGGYDASGYGAEPAPEAAPAAPRGDYMPDGRPADLYTLSIALYAEGITEDARIKSLTIRAGKSLGLEGVPPDWTGDQIADVFDEALKMHQAEIREAQEAAV